MESDNQNSEKDEDMQDDNFSSSVAATNCQLCVAFKRSAISKRLSLTNISKMINPVNSANVVGNEATNSRQSLIKVSYYLGIP